MKQVLSGAITMLAGHPVAPSTVYRLLAKAGWRKIVPRPSHPKRSGWSRRLKSSPRR
ncbi:MAG: winged helix-turn-helix domain-containing protein [Verrucomicrobia bacterium]|nr:winged helix-turn-helix domain-containing protein [Verrucomicrobiota bacterium]